MSESTNRPGHARQRRTHWALAMLAGALTLLGAASAPGAETEVAESAVAAQSVQAAEPRPLASKEAGSLLLEEPANDTEVFRQLSMERGKSAFVRSTYAVKRVSVGNPAVLDVVVISPQELQFVARGIGSTNVLVWDSGGRPKASIDVDVGNAYNHLQRELRRILENEDIQVDSAGNGIVLKGAVSSAVAMEQALKVTNAFLGDAPGEKVVNLLEVGGNQQVMLKVVLAEMARSVSREFGTNFNALIEYGNNAISISNFVGGLTGVDDDGDIVLSDAVNLVATLAGFGSLTFLEVFLDVLDQRGLAKILAEPTLVARSGEPATFLVGGEVAVPIAQGGAFGSITVEFKPFGVGVQFTPTVLESDRIHLQVAPEVSNVDFSLGTNVGGTVVPGFNTRRAGTSVELVDGQSFAIAGLLREELRELSGQYPLVGRIPILGSAFRSSTFEKRESELVIIVTPFLVKPLGPGPHPLPTDQFIEPTAAEFYLLGALEGHPSRKHAAYGGMIGDVGHRVQAAPEGGTE